MQTVLQSAEVTDMASVDHHEVVFCSEDQIAEIIGANEWVSPCGHDCCPCDRECK